MSGSGNKSRDDIQHLYAPTARSPDWMRLTPAFSMFVQAAASEPGHENRLDAAPLEIAVEPGLQLAVGLDEGRIAVDLGGACPQLRVGSVSPEAL